MGMNAVLLGYQARIVELQANASQLRLGQVIAVAMMGIALLAVLVVAFLALTRRTVPLPYSFLPLPVVVYGGRVSKKRNSALLQSSRLERYYKHGIARLEGTWAGSGITGEQFLRSDHPYDKDLHVFGEGSLFEFLCTCRTEVGRRRLAEYLLDTPGVEEVSERQAAIQELRSRSDLRDQISLLGDFSFQDSSYNTIADWLTLPGVGARSLLRGLALGTSACLATLLLGLSSVFTWASVVPLIVTILLLHSAVALVYRARLLDSLHAIRSVGLEIGVLRQGLSLLQSQKFQSALLNRLVESAKNHDAAGLLRKLERFIRVMGERDKEWYYAFSRALLVGTQVFWAIEEWRFRHSTALLEWLSVWGQFEALSALACYAHEHPNNVFPSFVPEEAVLCGRSIGHPLLPVNACVRNDIALNERTKFYVVSGSNMAGKSTFLRAIGLNAILAYCGAPVCAESMSLSIFSICASLSIQDSLLNGKSRFLAEMDRLKQAVTLATGQNPVLFLIDEILSGTNSKDRRIASEAILRALIERGARGVLSTHDLALTELADPAESRGANVHMGSKSGSNPMDFDYLVKAGVSTESSALAIARLAGVPV